MQKSNPKFGSIRFSCPHCGALAHQYWFELNSVPLEKDDRPLRYDRHKLEEFKAKFDGDTSESKPREYWYVDEFIRSTEGAVFQAKEQKNPYSKKVYNLEASRCDSCGELAIWMQDRMMYPIARPNGVASTDMPDKVRSLYDEAAAVFTTSPRSCAALLRLALQHLLIELGETGENINADIKRLEEKGLDAEIAKMMHALRIIGNEAVHPGQIDIDDEPYIAEALFDLLDQIVDQLITKPKKRNALWDRLPENKREEVEKRLSKREIKSE